MDLLFSDTIQNISTDNCNDVRRDMCFTVKWQNLSVVLFMVDSTSVLYFRLKSPLRNFDWNLLCREDLNIHLSWLKSHSRRIDDFAQLVISSIVTRSGLSRPKINYIWLFSSINKRGNFIVLRFLFSVKEILETLWLLSLLSWL